MKTISNFLFPIFFILPPSSLILFFSGCRTPPTKPVIVQVDPGEASGGRFRSLERQRDLWIAPQATDNETLLHEQLITFIEKPITWQLPSTIEPNTVSRPDLPIEQGDYDAEILKRQREIIQDKEAEALKIMAELENLKHQSQQTLNEKDEQLKGSEEKIEAAQRDLAKALEQLKAISQAEKLKREQEEEKRKNKHWWKLW